jgi:hypothetical protein
MTKNKKALLYSAGLDSFILWRLLNYPVAVYAKLEHSYTKFEYQTILNIKDNLAQFGLNMDLRVVDRLKLGDVELDDGYIPYRNLLLFTLAALEVPEANTIYFGALKGEANKVPSPTCTTCTT